MAQPEKYEVDDCRDWRASVLATHPEKGSETRKALIRDTGPIAHRNVALPKQALSPAIRRVRCRFVGREDLLLACGGQAHHPPSSPSIQVLLTFACATLRPS